MESIRKLVSGNRRRFVDDDYSLDLTFITPQIIAMSYPASGLESAYRNPVDKVWATNLTNCLKLWLLGIGLF